MTLSDFIEKVEMGIARQKRFDPRPKDLMLFVDRGTYQQVLTEFIDTGKEVKLKAEVKSG